MSLEDAFFAAAGIVNQRGLPGQPEKALVEEDIHLRQENPVAGMGVIPTDDSQIGVLLVHEELNVLPGVGGEGDLTGAAGGRLAFDHVLDEQEIAAVVVIDIADKDAADLGAGRGISVEVNAVERRLAEDHLKRRRAQAAELDKLAARQYGQNQPHRKDHFRFRRFALLP